MTGKDLIDFTIEVIKIEGSDRGQRLHSDGILKRIQNFTEAQMRDINCVFNRRDILDLSPWMLDKLATEIAGKEWEPTI